MDPCNIKKAREPKLKICLNQDGTILPTLPALWVQEFEGCACACVKETQRYRQPEDCACILPALIATAWIWI